MHRLSYRSFGSQGAPKRCAVPSIISLLVWSLYVISPALLANPPKLESKIVLSPLELSWFYKPPTDGTTTETLATQVKHFILTRNDENLRDQLRSSHVTTPILQYVRFDAIEDPCNGKCPCEQQPWNNQVAWEPGDFCDIQSKHPDWFLRSEAGNLISIQLGDQRHVWMDPGNSGWRDFWLARVKTSQKKWGWDGVFLDNVQASLGQFTKDKITVLNYPDDPTFQTAVKGFLEHIRNAYFIPEKHPLEGNIIFLPWGQEREVWQAYISLMDGAMLEDFAVGWRSGAFKSSQQWLSQIETLEDSQKKGKHVTLVAQGAQVDLERQSFALASYLLANRGLASFRYSDGNGQYNQFWDYESYSKARALGKPLKERQPQDQGAWRRDFENGYVTVNPEHHEGQIVLVPGSGSTLHGNNP